MKPEPSPFSMASIAHRLPWIREAVLRFGIYIDDDRRTADLVVCLQDQAVKCFGICESRRELLEVWCSFKRRIYEEFGLCAPAVQSLQDTRRLCRVLVASLHDRDSRNGQVPR